MSAAQGGTQALDSARVADPATRWSDLQNGQTALAIVAMLAMTLGPELAGARYWAPVLQLAVLYAASAIFMAILRFDAGQVSFGQGAVFALAAYAVGIACGIHGMPYAVGVVWGLVAAVATGLLFALPALRVQGYYLGFVTLSAAMVVPEMLVSLDAWTRGINGISLSLPALAEPIAHGVSPLALLIALLGVAALLLYRALPATAFGRRLRVSAESPEAARALGIDPGTMRCWAFLLTAFGTGCAGVLYPPLVGFVSPNAFHVELSILFFFAVVVGGAGQPLGPILGIGLLFLVPNAVLAQLAEYRLLIYGGLALAVMMLLPAGVAGTLASLLKARAARLRAPIRLHDVLQVLRDAPPLAGGGDDPVIEVHGARKRFGHVIALDGVDLLVRRGEIHGLVGANGSGKTSLLNLLSGFSRMDQGRVLVLGRETTRLRAHRIARLGVGRSFQTPRMFADLSAWDNLRIGLDARRGQPDAATRAVAEALRGAVGNRDVEQVPHGQRRVMEVLRVVMQGSFVLLLDEPAAGLSPEEREDFASLLIALRDRLGAAIVLVEHDLSLVWRIADRITVLETGRVVAQGSPAEVRRMPAAAHLFLGGGGA